MKEILFKKSHKKVCMGGRHSSAHGSSFHLIVPTSSPSSLNASTAAIPSNLLGILPPPKSFLDVDVHLNHGHLHLSVHIKPTDLQQNLNFSSCHPSSSPSFWPSGSGKSAASLITSTPTPPTSLNSSLPEITSILHNKTNFLCPPL